MIVEAINPELSESEWIESESIRQLMQSRAGMMAITSFAMLVMTRQRIPLHLAIEGVRTTLLSA